jgi:uncharacterized protein YjbK
MNRADENLEIEIKLQLGNFTDYLKLIGFLGNIDSEDHQENCFFDTEDRQLATAGWALRVRVSDGKGLVTVKGLPSSEAGSAVVRQEIEAAIPRSAALDITHLQSDILELSVEPIAFIKEKFPGIKLAKLINFRTVRQRKNYKIGDYHYVLEIDKTEFVDGSVDYELEVELPDTEQVVTVEDSLRKLFNSLAIPFQKQTESKFARALQHARFM